MKKIFLTGILMLVIGFSTLPAYAAENGTVTVTYAPEASGTVIDREPSQGSGQVHTGVNSEWNEYTKWMIATVGAIIVWIFIKRKQEADEERDFS